MSTYNIEPRENPFQFYASEFIGDIPTVDDLYSLEAPVGSLAYVIDNGLTYIQAYPGIWKHLQAGKGSTGSRGLQGREGCPGAPGRDGKTGRDGLRGIQGLPGLEGQPGRNGVNGRDGLNGRDGTDGKDGKSGAPGLPGKDGIDGQPGKVGSTGKPGQDGKDGKGWVGGLYDHESGRVIFKSNDGLSFMTGDLRGAPAPLARFETLKELAEALRPFLND